jgi:nucleoside-diphosphate-sugar epimerase
MDPYGIPKMEAEQGLRDIAVETGLEIVIIRPNKLDIRQRLCGSLQVDISKTRQLLGWKPLVTVGRILKSAADDFKRASQANNFQ